MDTTTSQPTRDMDAADVAFERSLTTVLSMDKAALLRARMNYGESWCKRGGVGAFMMLARKWDRLENFLTNRHAPSFQPYDILTAAQADQRPEGVIDDIRDLRRYLTLIEAKLVEKNVCPGMLKKDQHDIAIAPLASPEAVEQAIANVHGTKPRPPWRPPHPTGLDKARHEAAFTDPSTDGIVTDKE